MPRGMYKSRSLRRVFTRSPSGVSKLHYEQRKPQGAQCAGCGAKLNAVPRARAAEMARIPKTKKRPERPFGGVLCSKCLRDTIKLESRV